MCKFYLAFLKCATVSHKLSWSHYIELLYTDGMDPSFSTPWDSFVLTLPKFNVDGVEDVYISSDGATNQGGQKDILYSWCLFIAVSFRCIKKSAIRIWKTYLVADFTFCLLV